MSIYFSATNFGFYPEDLKKDYIKSGTWPIDAIEVEYKIFEQFGLNPPPPGFQRYVENGLPCWIEMPAPSIDSLKTSERLWLKLELDRVRDELEKVQDSDPKAYGSVADWRTYRKNLRVWPEHQNFPNKEYRPIAPTV